MDCRRLIDILNNNEIRQRVVNMAKAFTRNRNWQEWLFTHGWIAIAESEPDKTMEYYTGLAYAVMRNKYEVYVMPPPKRYRNDDAGTRRATKRLKKYIKDGVN